MANEIDALDIQSAAGKFRELSIQNLPDNEEAVDKAVAAAEVEDPVKEETEEPEQDLSAKADETEEESSEARKSDADTDADEVVTVDVEQLASLIGVDPSSVIVDDKGEMRFRTKVDGKVSETTLSDMLKSYQLDAHLTNRGKELTAKQQKFEQDYESFMANSNQLVQQVAATLQALEADYQQENAAVDWTTLRNEDPAEYAARRAEMGQRKEALDQKRQAIIQQIQQVQQGQQQQSNQYIALKLQQENQALQNAITRQQWPAWDALRPQLVSYLEDTGFTSKELEGLYDHRLIVIANKARLFDQGKQNLKGKQLKVLPKVLKPGAKPARNVVSNQRLDDARKNLSKTGSVEAAAAVFKRLAKE